MNCQRCHGLLIPIKLNAGSSPETVFYYEDALSCVNCGNVLNKVIKENRENHHRGLVVSNNDKQHPRHHRRQW